MKTKLMQATVHVPHHDRVMTFVTDLENVYLFELSVIHIADGDEIIVGCKIDIIKEDIEFYNKLPITKFYPAIQEVVELVAQCQE